MDRRNSSNKASLRHQVAAGRYVLLALTGLTLINLLFLVLKVEYHFLLSAAVPYYVNWLAVKLAWPAGWSVVMALLSLILVGFYGVCWVLSQRQRIWWAAAMAAYLLDTLLLIIFAATLLKNPASCVLEILVHVGVAYLLFVADQATGALQRLRQRRRMAQKERERV